MSTPDTTPPLPSGVSRVERYSMSASFGGISTNIEISAARKGAVIISTGGLYSVHIPAVLFGKVIAVLQLLAPEPLPAMPDEQGSDADTAPDATEDAADDRAVIGVYGGGQSGAADQFVELAPDSADGVSPEGRV